MAIEQILNWFRKAVPAPEKRNFTTQTGVHVEEFGEMLDNMVGDTPEADARLAAFRDAVHAFAADMKAGQIPFSITDAVEFTDAICDQLVTAVGIAHMANVDIVPAIHEVADSNDSKFDKNGQPILHPETRKILKSSLYFKANLVPHAAATRFVSAK